METLQENLPPERRREILAQTDVAYLLGKIDSTDWGIIEGYYNPYGPHPTLVEISRFSKIDGDWFGFLAEIKHLGTMGRRAIRRIKESVY